MKNIRWVALAIVLLLGWSCGSKDKNEEPALTYDDIVGTWQVKSWTGQANNPDGTSYTFSDVVYIYVVLKSDQSFELYQNISSIGPAKFTGQYTFSASTIHGSYRIGNSTTFWSDSYTVSGVSSNSMTWTATHATGDVQQLVRVEGVPQEVLDEVVEVRSSLRSVSAPAFL